MYWLITLLLQSSTLPHGTFLAFAISIFTIGYDLYVPGMTIHRTSADFRGQQYLNVMSLLPFPM